LEIAMTQQAALSQDQQIAFLTQRIVQLETLNEERRKRLRFVAPLTSFLGFLMTAFYAGVFIASITLTNLSGHLSALLQSVMFSSCIASTLFVFISLLAKGEITPPEKKVAVAAVTAA
jgi:hypothetical protein